ncbi:hypothetical protein E9993_16090 [Labilibacter sediminis]|nr:hypothetical protein E9993_16090 [Labilibacter sediminis]
MKTLNLIVFGLFFLVLSISCSKDKDDEQTEPDNTALIVNGKPYALHKAYITYVDEGHLMEGYQYDLDMVSSGVDMDNETGIGEGVLISIITSTKDLIAGTYTFESDPAREIGTFSAFVVIRFHLATWERQHFFVISSGTLVVTKNSENNYTVTLSAKANDIDDNDEIITSNNDITVNFTGTFTRQV